jgi:hypothetical protein
LSGVETGVSGLRVIVLGYVVRGPMGGMAWHHLQYVLGLARLGCDVWFVEDSDDYPSCYDPDRGVVDTDPTYGLRFAAAAFQRLGLSDCWAYHDAHKGVWHGPRAERVRRALRRADLVLNVSGVNPLRPWLADIPVRVLIDTDPVFTQIRHLIKPADRALAEQHTAFFSFGENIAKGTATAPNDGLPWEPTRQPVVLDAWPVIPGPATGLYTTVMQWDSYPAQRFRGRRYGMKSLSFGPYKDLPAAAGPVFELALGSASAPRTSLRKRGWAIRDPHEVTRDPWAYQDYIRSSKAEFGVAKQGYVVSRCGWFSERSACYLASGRPVLVQNTGFTDWLPTGAGVLAFSDPDEAAAGVAEIAGHYRRHCRAARQIAAEYFDARKVLDELIERAMTINPQPVNDG